MEKQPPMVMVENLAHDATNQMLRDIFAEFQPKRVRIVYRNSIPKGTAPPPPARTGGAGGGVHWLTGRAHTGFAGLEFEREEQALAACRQRNGAAVLGRPITCRMADARDLTWFDSSKPTQDKRRQRRSGDWTMGDSSPRRWDTGGGGGGGGGDYNPSFPTSVPPSQQAPPGPGGGGGSMNQEILAHQIMNTLSSIGMGGPPPRMGGGPMPAMGGVPQGGGPFGPMGVPSPGLAPVAAAPRPLVTNTTDKEFAPDLKSIDIREHTFFFVDFNLAYGSSGMELPIPVELAVLAFSFGGGEKASFHRFVDPGQIPRCYLADAYHNTNSVHGIPHHGFQLAEKNYRHLYNEMTNFISQFLTASTPFVSIYAKGAATKNACFSWLSQKAGQPPLFCIVRNVEEVIEHLHEIASSPVTSSSICSLFATDAALSSPLPSKCPYHDVSAAAAGGSTTTSSPSSTASAPAAASASTPGAAPTASPTLSSPSSSLVQATHTCALANVRHVASCVMAAFNKLDVPFK